MKGTAGDSVSGWYERDLASDEWRRRREKVLARAGYQCEGCLINEATEVHHIDYSHVGAEYAWELRAVCSRCHRALHPSLFPRVATPTPQPTTQEQDHDMARYAQMFPGRYLKADDVADGELVLTITDIREEFIGNGADREKKWTAGFHETSKRLVLNKTRASSLVKMFGDNTDDWLGRVVICYAATTSYGGEEVAALRLRAPTPAGPRPQAPAPPPTRTPPWNAGEEGDTIPY